MKYLKNLPLIIAYFLYPTVNIIARIFKIKISNYWIDILWVFLLIITFFLFPFIKRRKNEEKYIKLNSSIFFICICYLSFKLLQFLVAINNEPFSLIPFMMEMKPIFYFLFSIIWFYTFGIPSKRSFLIFGIILVFIYFLDFMVEGFILNQGLIRVRGSGEPNYDATLLGLSYLLSSRRNKRIRLIILLGIAATFSRTTLFAVLLIILINEKFSGQKVVILLIGALAFAYSFIFRELSTNMFTMDRYWMWKTFFDALFTNSIKFILGYPIGISLPLNIPANLYVLWSSQETAWGLNGIFPYNFHSMWIRLILSFGIPIVVGIILFFTFYMIRNRSNRKMTSFFLFILIEGMSMGVFYLSNVGIPCFIVLLMLISDIGEKTSKAEKFYHQRNHTFNKTNVRIRGVYS